MFSFHPTFQKNVILGTVVFCILLFYMFLSQILKTLTEDFNVFINSHEQTQ